MAKTMNRVKASEFEAAARVCMAEMIERDWNGLSIRISPTLPINKMLEFTANVVESCFDNDGNYIPEILDFAVKYNIIDKYTNIALPKDMSKQYELLTRSNICDFILQFVDQHQFNEMIRAIDRRLRHLSEARVSELHAAIKRVIDIFSTLQERISVAADNLAGVDMEELMQKFSNFSEQAVVKEYAAEIRKWAEPTMTTLKESENEL